MESRSRIGPVWLEKKPISSGRGSIRVEGVMGAEDRKCSRWKSIGRCQLQQQEGRAWAPDSNRGPTMSSRSCWRGADAGDCRPFEPSSHDMDMKLEAATTLAPPSYVSKAHSAPPPYAALCICHLWCMVHGCVVCHLSASCSCSMVSQGARRRRIHVCPPPSQFLWKI
jgi:hypothetical protein